VRLRRAKLCPQEVNGCVRTRKDAAWAINLSPRCDARFGLPCWSVVNIAPSNPALKRTIASLAPLGRLLAA
jgi:hypothetical protein